MSAESNKQIVLNAWNSLRTRSPEQIAPYFAVDAEWVAPEGNATAVALGAVSGMKSREGIVRFICEDFGKLFARDVNVDITAAVAEGELVVLEQRFRALLSNGRTYDNRYCFIFVVRDGVIHQMREFMDTARGFRMIFGDEQPRKIA